MIRFDRLQQGLVAMFSGIAESVHWAGAELPNKDTMLVLDVVGGPERLRSGARGFPMRPAASLVLLVAGVEEDVRVIARLNGFDYAHDIGASETVTDVRNALLAQITDGEAGAVTAAAVDDDRIALTADFLGGLRSLELLGADVDGEPLLGFENLVIEDEAVAITSGTDVFLVNAQAYSKGRAPRDGALALISEARDRTESRARVDELGRYGVKFRTKGTPTNLRAVAGAHWESRYSWDVRVAAKSIAIEPVGQIEHATIGITVGNERVTAEVDAPA